MNQKKAIFWDLDETMGDFEALKTNGHDPVDEDTKAAKRYGIEKVLESLSSRGYNHFVTSFSPPDYVKRVVELSGLAPYFSAVFGGGETYFRDSKGYAAAAKHAGLFNGEAAHSLIVVGDSPNDKPCDLEGVVFIHQPRGYAYDAAVVQEIVTALDALGKGSFIRGFEAMHSQAKEIPLRGGKYASNRRIFSLSGGLELELSYNSNGCPDAEDKKHPIIFVGPAPQYEREPVQF